MSDPLNNLFPASAGVAEYMDDDQFAEYERSKTLRACPRFEAAAEELHTATKSRTRAREALIATAIGHLAALADDWSVPVIEQIVSHKLLAMYNRTSLDFEQARQHYKAIARSIPDATAEASDGNDQRLVDFLHDFAKTMRKALENVDAEEADHIAAELVEQHGSDAPVEAARGLMLFSHEAREAHAKAEAAQGCSMGMSSREGLRYWRKG